MKLTVDACDMTAKVGRDNDQHLRVFLQLRDIVLSLSPAEATHLATQLVDSLANLRASEERR